MQKLARNITVIPPRAGRGIDVASETCKEKKRVAAYARVSTDTEEQITSYEAQVDYYTRFIQANPDWTFSGVYTDEGITATNTKKRNGFNRMIADALRGEIDLILTKSVSRFARNTVDTLTAVRKLKEKGVEVFFEKEQIYTLDSKGELLITIMSSLAQEESRSISENVTWGQRKRFADGKVRLPYKRFLGYEKGEDGLPKIVPEQAKVVASIYTMFLDGKMPSTIANILTKQNVPSPGGKDKWQISTVESILTNEKYMGDAILQKRFTVDFLTKKQKVNEGEVPQYYVRDSHPAIVSAEIFEEVQAELERRKAAKYSSRGGCFSSRIICGECGAFYGPKVWHSNDKYRRVIWQCNHKYSNGTPCSTPYVEEKKIKTAFVEVINKIFENKEAVIAGYREVIHRLTECSEPDTETASLQTECEIVIGLIQKMVAENANEALDQNEYLARYNELVTRYETAKSKIEKNEADRQARKVKRDKLTEFIDQLEERGGLLSEFDEELWNATVETVMVKNLVDIRFVFKGGSELQTSII